MTSLQCRLDGLAFGLFGLFGMFKSKRVSYFYTFPDPLYFYVLMFYRFIIIEKCCMDMAVLTELSTQKLN